MAKIDIQQIADCFAGAEIDLVRAIKEVGEIPLCLDTAAREANKAGMDLRACALGGYDRRLGEIVAGLCSQLAALKQAHCDLIAIADRLEIPLPQPKGGGR